MNAIKEEVLKLPLEEKFELFHALQDDLGFDSDVDNEELPAGVWAEIKRGEALIESGEAKWIDQEELESFLKERRKAL